MRGGSASMVALVARTIMDISTEHVDSVHVYRFHRVEYPAEELGVT